MSTPREEFLGEAIWHGGLDKAEAVLAANPGLRRGDIHVAAILGDEAEVRACLARDPSSVSAGAPPFGGNALNYLGLSKYLRFHPERTPEFLRTAAALLDAGADPDSGFWNEGEFETALYGAAGVAHNTALTKLLLDGGANPNDEDAVYHVGESRDLGPLKAMVETGRLTGDSLSLLLIRKIDWHDHEGIRYLLEHGGADANFARTRGMHALHHALARDNSLDNIELLLDHGADPEAAINGLTAVVRACGEGRSDVLEAMRNRGVSMELKGFHALVYACAIGDTKRARGILEKEPQLRAELDRYASSLLSKYAGTCNGPGVRTLLDVGIDVNTPFADGDGYFGIPKGALPIHVAAWRACPPVVMLLIERGADVNAVAPDGATPLALAIRACVDSYWTEYRSPESVKALLEAGAAVDGVRHPSGYSAIDDLITSAREKHHA